MLRLFGNHLQKSQDLSFVTINGHGFKRLILRDSYMAEKIEQNLGKFGPSDFFPPLVTRFENEIWVEFLDGAGIKVIDEARIAQFAALYHSVYVRRPRQVDLDQTIFADRLRQDLRFLNQVGVLSVGSRRDLLSVAQDIAPDRVWVGFDYVDPVLKNFIERSDGLGLCAIDVESLVDGQLIGIGVAKACVHWLEPNRVEFCRAIAKLGPPDFLAYFPFVELCLIARWSKTKFLTGKLKFVDPKLFDRFLTDQAADSLILIIILRVMILIAAKKFSGLRSYLVAMPR